MFPFESLNFGFGYKKNKKTTPGGSEPIAPKESTKNMRCSGADKCKDITCPAYLLHNCSGNTQWQDLNPCPRKHGEVKCVILSPDEVKSIEEALKREKSAMLENSYSKMTNV